VPVAPCPVAGHHWKEWWLYSYSDSVWPSRMLRVFCPESCSLLDNLPHKAVEAPLSEVLWSIWVKIWRICKTIFFGPLGGKRDGWVKQFSFWFLWPRLVCVCHSLHRLSQPLLICFPLSVPQLSLPFTPFTWEKTSTKVSTWM